jgi:hypothetical protein
MGSCCTKINMMIVDKKDKDKNTQPKSDFVDIPLSPVKNDNQIIPTTPKKSFRQIRDNYQNDDINDVASATASIVSTLDYYQSHAINQK